MTHDRRPSGTRDKHPAADAFVAGFEAAWTEPTPAGFDHLFADPIRLIAPLIPTTDGRVAAERSFASLLDLLPDLTAEVEDWVPTADGVMIDHVFTATLGRRPVRWRGIDRFVLDAAGRALERVHFADSTPPVRAAARTPSSWRRARRAGAVPGRPMGTSHHPSAPASPTSPAERPGALPFAAVGATTTVVRSGTRGDLTCDEVEVELAARGRPVRFRAAATRRRSPGGHDDVAVFYDRFAVRMALRSRATIRPRLPQSAAAPEGDRAAG